MNFITKAALIVGTSFGYLSDPVETQRQRQQQEDLETVEIDAATRGLGELGENVHALYHLQRYIQDGSRIANGTCPNQFLGMKAMNADTGETYDGGDAAWHDSGQSGVILKAKISDTLDKLTLQDYQSLTPKLRAVVDSAFEVVGDTVKLGLQTAVDNHYRG